MDTCPVHGEEPCPAKNRHHLWWPRKSYKSQLEKEFRKLHIVWMCVEAHKLLHATTLPPKKPSAREMRQAIERKKAEEAQPCNWKSGLAAPPSP